MDAPRPAFRIDYAAQRLGDEFDLIVAGERGAKGPGPMNAAAEPAAELDPSLAKDALGPLYELIDALRRFAGPAMAQPLFVAAGAVDDAQARLAGALRHARDERDMWHRTSDYQAGELDRRAAHVDQARSIAARLEEELASSYDRCYVLALEQLVQRLIAAVPTNGPGSDSVFDPGEDKTMALARHLDRARATATSAARGAAADDAAAAAIDRATGGFEVDAVRPQIRLGSAPLNLPIVTDPSVPPGCFELRDRPDGRVLVRVRIRNEHRSVVESEAEAAARRLEEGQV